MMKPLDKALPIACLAALCATSAFAKPKADCGAVFSLELNTRLSLRNLKVLGDPHHYESGDAYLEVREFDTDFQPLRRGGAGVAVVSASGLDASDDVVGGMVLSKQPAYFMEADSEALNKKGGLNAVFEVGQNDECAGTTYIVHFEANGVLSVNGKPLAKVLVSPNP
jgi:hypothetical protein